MQQLMPQRRLQRSARPQQFGRLHVDPPPLRMRGHPAWLARGVSKRVEIRVNAHLNVSRQGQARLLGNTPRRPLHQREHHTIAIRTGGQHRDSLAPKPLPGDATPPQPHDGTRIIERQNLTPGMPRQPHLLRATLAQPHAMSRPRSFEDRPTVRCPNLIPVAQHAAPTQLAPHRKAERPGADPYRFASAPFCGTGILACVALAVPRSLQHQGACPSRPGPFHDRNPLHPCRRAKLRPSKCLRHQQRIGVPLPRGARAVRIVVALQIRRGQLRPHRARILGPPAAIARVGSERRLALEPQQFTRSLGGDRFHTRSHRFQIEPLAMGAGAKVEALAGMPPAQPDRISARRHRHGLQRLVRPKDAALPRENTRYILLDRQFDGARALRRADLYLEPRPRREEGNRDHQCESVYGML